MSDVMRAIEKMWTVIYTINEAHKITPTKEPCTITIEAFSSMAKDDVDKILRKLDKDDNVINLINVPDSWAIIKPSSDPDAYKYVIGVLPAFQSFFEDTYRLYHQGIHKLEPKNFLAIHELVLDIGQKIEMADSNIVTVEVLNRVMRFPAFLFPKDSRYFRDEYCDLRIQSANYLKKQGAIRSYELINNQGSGWDAKLKIEFDAFAFDGFADKTKARYKEEFYSKSSDNSQTKLKANIKPDEEKPKEKATSIEEQEVAASKVGFDTKTSVLSLGDQTCDIPDETLEYYLCKLAFKNRRVAVKEIDILENSTKSLDSKRPVYDAMLRVNKKARENIGISKLFYYKAAKIRMTKEYQ